MAFRPELLFVDVFLGAFQYWSVSAGDQINIQVERGREEVEVGGGEEDRLHSRLHKCSHSQYTTAALERERERWWRDDGEEDWMGEQERDGEGENQSERVETGGGGGLRGVLKQWGEMIKVGGGWKWEKRGEEIQSKRAKRKHEQFGHLNTRSTNTEIKEVNSR